MTNGQTERIFQMEIDIEGDRARLRSSRFALSCLTQAMNNALHGGVGITRRCEPLMRYDRADLRQAVREIVRGRDYEIGGERFSHTRDEGYTTVTIEMPVQLLEVMTDIFELLLKEFFEDPNQLWARMGITHSEGGQVLAMLRRSLGRDQ